jgi:hypothetical protein
MTHSSIYLYARPPGVEEPHYPLVQRRISPAPVKAEMQ